jgi:hypothetical protein
MNMTRKILVLFLFLFISPVVGLGEEIIDSSNITERSDGGVYLVYKKFSNKPFTGTITGRVQSKIVNGFFEGPYLLFCDSGQISDEGQHRRSVRVGYWIHYDIDCSGNWMMKGPYNKDGEKDGVWLLFPEDGFVFRWVYQNDSLVESTRAKQ